jgi:C4-dicarboxylate-specific signal transduction histidine kinase
VTALGEMTASIAHEINQPLAAVVNNASASLRWLAANKLGEVRQSIELNIADGHRAAEIINRIRALAKKAPPQKDWVSISETIAEFIRRTAKSNGIASHCKLNYRVTCRSFEEIESNCSK